jgi:CubicO group peptidase (beta-lactamase class C family)
MTLINNEYPVRFSCKDANTCGNFFMNYSSGNGTPPTPSAAENAPATSTQSRLVTGSTSGAKAKIVGFSGNGTTGTLYVFNPGTFTNGETITDAGGFSATLGNTMSPASTNFFGGKITITNSILALTAPYVNYNTAGQPEGNKDFYYNGVLNTQDEATFLAGSGNVIWKQGVTGTDPLFAHPDNSGWLGCSNDFDPTLAGYPGVKGYYHNAADTCVYPVGQEPVVCPDCSYVTASAITFS